MSYLGEITKTRDPLVNYITNGRAYNNATGWNTYADAAGTQPVDGTGGSPNITFSRNTTSPLRQASDFRLVKDAANRQGQGVSYDFTVDNADLATVLTVSFDYSVISGTYADGNLAIYLIQDPSGTPVVIQPAGYTIMSATAGIPMTAVATFQTASNVSSYRLCLHIASTTTSAFTLAFDNVSVSPQTAPIGPIVTDWVSYTPTGTWVSGATYSGRWRRVGDSLQASIKIGITGAVTATDLQVNIPAGLSIDTAKMASSDFLQSTFGAAHGFKGAAHYNFQIAYSSTTSLFFTYQSQLTGQVVSVTNTAPVTWANGDQIHATFQVPISGWSSAVQQSSDTDTRVVAAKISMGTTGGTITLPAQNTPYYWIFDPSSSVTKDTHGAIVLVGAGPNVTTTYANASYYQIPVSGWYKINASTAYANSGVTGFKRTVIYVNGSAVVENVSVSTLEFTSAVQNINFFNAGDIIKIGSIFTGGSNQAITIGSTAPTFAMIERLSGPSVIAATETVACHVETAAGPTITTGSGSAVSFPTKVYDTHNAFSGTTYTVPVSGKYRITALLTMVNTSGTSVMFSDIYVNGTLSKNLTAVYPYLSNLNNHRINGSVTLNLSAGQTVQLFGGSGTAIALFPSAAYNYFIIERVGN
jgi:hypothetical protein